MNRILLVFLSAIALLVISCAQGPPEEGSASAEREPAAALGERIAGTWLGTYEIDAPEAAKTGYIATYHADGTAVTTSERMFGAGHPDRHGLSSTNHVQWEATGPRAIRWRVLHFGYDSDGSLTYVSRSHGTREFDEDFESSRGSSPPRPCWIRSTRTIPPASRSPRQRAPTRPGAFTSASRVREGSSIDLTPGRVRRRTGRGRDPSSGSP
jgi:hypothetical protein